MRKVYMVDSENVSDVWLSILSFIEPEDKMTVFYTDNTPKISYDAVILLRSIDHPIEFIKCGVGGKAHNALDFQLVSELGYRLHEDPDAEYIIVSNDNGFMPVIYYWNEKGMHTGRYNMNYCRALEKRAQDENRKEEYDRMAEEELLAADYNEDAATEDLADEVLTREFVSIANETTENAAQDENAEVTGDIAVADSEDEEAPEMLEMAPEISITKTPEPVAEKVEESTETPAEAAKDLIEAPAEAAKDLTEAPAEAAEEKPEAPAEAAEEKPEAPTESAEEKPEALTEVAEEKIEAPTEVAEEKIEAPTESAEEKVEALTETSAAAAEETQPAEEKAEPVVVAEQTEKKRENSRKRSSRRNRKDEPKEVKEAEPRKQEEKAGKKQPENSNAKESKKQDKQEKQLPKPVPQKMEVRALTVEERYPQLNTPEDIAKFFFAIFGPNDLPDAHNEMIAIYGSQDTDDMYYKFIKENLKAYKDTIQIAEPEIRFSRYCWFLLERAGYPEAIVPKDLHAVLYNNLDSAKNLNTFRRFLAARYGKKDGQQLYSILKNHIKAMTRIA